MKAYLDASAIVPYFTAEDTTLTVVRFFRTHTDSLHVGTFAAGEVASAVSRLRRTEHLSRANADAALSALDDWLGVGTEIISIIADDIITAALFVRRFEFALRMPDAIYVATCGLLDLTLVTFDTRLLRAARAIGVAVVIPA